MQSDIVTRLRDATAPRLEMGWPAPHVVQRKEPLWIEAADEIERLRAELAAAIQQRDGYIDGNRQTLRALAEANEIAARYKRQRDEARRILCEEWAKEGFPFDWKGRRGPEGMADLVKWDCFAQQEGGGA